MNLSVQQLSYVVILAPLLASMITGLLGQVLGKTSSHRIAIVLLGIAFVASIILSQQITFSGVPTQSFNIYTWAISGAFTFHIGFMLDQLSTIMACVVLFISFLVHIYSIGYMAGDPGYQRFFSYISLFTFMMLLLVLANNFLQLFIGWEGVGLVSYLLIGFWFQKESANAGSLKAFIVNRVGDFGFLLGLAVVLVYFGSLDYHSVFMQAPTMVHKTIPIIAGHPWSMITVLCILLFIGAMGKSAQMPLHVWLPESMEGPTPISALIHAATMVTAGIFMVCRLSPLYEYSQTALSFILVIGATGALFTGLVGIVQNDIKRVIAYSTLSQLGYMVAGLGVSAYSASLFHLITHACFKALLFLAAGSVILSMHHEQDMRQMGGLRRYMPVTYITFLIGSLALAAIPPFSGFYSKDMIIDTVQAAVHVPGSTYAYICLVLGAFVTALYIFRAFFLVFHGTPRMSVDKQKSLKESGWVIGLPLICLAIPSAIIGFILIKPLMYAHPGLLKHSVFVLPQNRIWLHNATDSYAVIWQHTWTAELGLPFYMALLGVIVAWYAYQVSPGMPKKLAQYCAWPYRVLVNKYGFDAFNERFFVRGTRALAHCFFYIVDLKCIDGYVVNGTGKLTQFVSKVMRKTQTGYVYHYIFSMILGLLIFLVWLIM